MTTFDDLLSSYARLVSLFSDAADTLADTTGAALAALRPLRKSASAVAQALLSDGRPGRPPAERALADNRPAAHRRRGCRALYGGFIF